MSHDYGNSYYRYYASQAGGELSVLHGGQHGAGLGDVLRGILRWVTPIAIRGLRTFATSAMQAHEKGVSFKDAAKSSILPALGEMGKAVVQRMHDGEASQTGSGAFDSSAMFAGVQGVPFSRVSNAYKRKRNLGDGIKSTNKSGCKAKRRRTTQHTAINF